MPTLSDVHCGHIARPVHSVSRQLGRVVRHKVHRNRLCIWLDASLFPVLRVRQRQQRERGDDRLGHHENRLLRYVSSLPTLKVNVRAYLESVASRSSHYLLFCLFCFAVVSQTSTTTAPSSTRFPLCTVHYWTLAEAGL